MPTPAADRHAAVMNMDTTITAEDLLANQAWLKRLACRLVDPATAEDLVQETWAAAVRSRPERDRPLRPWLAEVLRNPFHGCADWAPPPVAACSGPRRSCWADRPLT
jgi:hypothetical protein